jgi:hypothetical protein
MFDTAHARIAGKPAGPAAVLAQWYSVANGVRFSGVVLEPKKRFLRLPKRALELRSTLVVALRGSHCLRLATPLRCRSGLVIRWRGRCSVFP